MAGLAHLTNGPNHHRGAGGLSVREVVFLTTRVQDRMVRSISNGSRECATDNLITPA